MAENLGTGVSLVLDNANCAYDTVVFQKGKPPMDTELNLVQQLQRYINQRQLTHLPSGWLTLRPFYASTMLTNKFYSQNPTGAIPEYALVNGYIVHVTNTATSEPNTNLIDLGTPPTSGNVVNGVFLEVWRALLDPSNSTNRPDPLVIVDSINDIDMVNANYGYAVGQNGLVLGTSNGGLSWNLQAINTKYDLNSVSFADQNHGWTAGNNGVIGRTASGGVRWSMLDTTTVENLRGIYALDLLTVWVVGDSGTILKALNGITFTSQVSGTTSGLRGVYFHDSNVGWAVGEKGTILKTTNGGRTWLPQSSGTTATLNSAIFYDLNFGIAVGDGGTLLRTCNGGSTWVSQSSNVWNGSAYVQITSDLNDVALAPSLDEYIDGAEVTSQFTGSNKNCTVLEVPVTKGDGNGTITNTPGDIVVKVNGVAVGVDVLMGATGQIVLSAAPRAGDIVKVYYYRRIATGTFRGRLWVVGKSNTLTGSTLGTVLMSDDLGGHWDIQDPHTAYDLNAASVVDRSVGWLVGTFSVIRNTTNGGSTWGVQQSEAITHQEGRVYAEGNVATAVYADDDMIHPDPNIETTKRVQLQYRIRVVNGIDPVNYPDAGLGMPSLFGHGPNTSGAYVYQNMGTQTGDFGLWSAKCLGTVDGYVYAIPMFVVNRRNTTAYDPASNANGSHIPGTTAIRLDLLTASNVVTQDILDVRRVSVAPDLTEVLDRSFDLLSANALRTVFGRNTTGGDRYGSEILQVDRVAGVSGGDYIQGIDLAAVIAGHLSSQASDGFYTTDMTASYALPAPVTLGPIGGVFHQNSAYYSVTYDASGSAYDGKPVPGQFVGMGTNTVNFSFASDANTKTQDALLQNYHFQVRSATTDTTSLNYIATTPGLVKNVQSSSTNAFYYRGVDEQSTGTVIEQWDSGIPGRANYVVAFPATGAAAQQNLASTVEMHQFKIVTSSLLDGTDVNKILIDSTATPVSGDVSWDMHTISKINNLDGGFSYKLKDTSVGNKITIESVSGFPFLVGNTIEIVSSVLYSINSVRTGATVNFVPGRRGVEKFCASRIGHNDLDTPSIDPSVSITIPNSEILGVSTTETATSLLQHVAWVTPSGIDSHMYPVSVSGFGTDTITLQFSGTIPACNVSTQCLYRQTQFTYQSDSSAVPDGLLIGYSYAPYQCIEDLPTTLTVQIVAKPQSVTISNLGTGGGVEGSPYVGPIQHIPLNDPTLFNDNGFYNFDPFEFNNISIDTGLAQMPIYVPGSTAAEVTFSNPSKDHLGRGFYSTASREITFSAEGLTMGNPRKIYVTMIGRVRAVSDAKLVNGEYVLVVMSRNALVDKNNMTGWQANSNCAIAVYRLPYKPIVRT